MKNKIAVVGMECIYPGAPNYRVFWENICAGRKAFRKMPEVRLNSGYFSNDADGIYQDHVAVIENYSFDRVKYKIPLSTYETADICHWLALDVATRAMENAGLLKNGAVKKTMSTLTGVYVGNTLTGEMTRSNLLRQRWPYVSQVVREHIDKTNLFNGESEKFIEGLEERYKSAFPLMQEDSLAGGLSNTIAGRICNYYDFNGGGYTVDAACGSSLLAITTACKAIESNEVSMALAGGVDISLDPFELVGFSRAGALARGNMNVFTDKSEGFWPGEGCGFVALMNAELAEKKGLDIYCYINGYGISSDGKGGITRPNAKMQEAAIRKAYPNDSLKQLTYVEAHGTGTNLGDEVELTALNEVATSCKRTVYIGAVKELIGHTKAAAGIAGFIKSVLINVNRKIPIKHNYLEENKILTNSKYLKLPKKVYQIKEKLFVTGVSAFGFGGINVHMSLLNSDYSTHLHSKPTSAIYQDAEIFLFSAKTRQELCEFVKRILKFSDKISIQEMADLSYRLFKDLLPDVSERLSVSASSPEQLTARLKKWLTKRDEVKGDFSNVSWSGSNQRSRIGFLFPGQGSNDLIWENLFINRFPFINLLVERFRKNNGKPDLTDTSVAQSYIARNTAIALEILGQFGIDAAIGIGHSLGEVSSLYWGNSISFSELIEFTEKRGQIMQDYGDKDGRMLSVSGNMQEVKQTIGNSDVFISCLNSLEQTIVSGKETEILEFQNILQKRKIPNIYLNVKRAFHSPLMKAGTTPFAKIVSRLNISPARKTIYSPTLKRVIKNEKEIRNMLVSQLEQPVSFFETFKKADEQVDLWIEVGAGNTLQKLVKSQTKTPVVSMDISTSHIGILNALGACFVNRVQINLNQLFVGRTFKTFDLEWSTKFIQNPCEIFDEKYIPLPKVKQAENENKVADNNSSKYSENENVIDTLKNVLAEKIGLPISSINKDSKMLDDLHLNSIVVGNIIAETATLYNFKTTKTPTEYANASVEEIAASFHITTTEEYVKKETELPKEVWADTYKIIWEEIAVEKIVDSDANNTNGVWTTFGKEMPEIKISGDGAIMSFIDLSDEAFLRVLSAFSVSIKDQLPKQLVVLDSEPRCGGWTKSFFQQYQTVNVLSIEVNDSVLISSIVESELSMLDGYRQVKYENGKRHLPYLKRISIPESTEFLLSPNAVTIVSGGGSGITAECALALAKKYKNKTVIIGRTVQNNKKISDNLKRFERLGLVCEYIQYDVTNDKFEIDNIKSIKDLGDVKLILHGAGNNVPQSFENTTDLSLQSTLAPKRKGLSNLLKHFGESVNKVITFGSIIARSGMEGNAEYALANEWMANDLEQWSDAHGNSWLNVEWSVWSGTGMGDKLGVLEQLRAKGIDPINIENGVEKFLQLVSAQAIGNIIVAGRYGSSKTLENWKPIFSANRFIKEVEIYYPERELIANFEFSPESDPYLDEHKLKNVRIVPTVIWIEAMSQAFSKLFNQSTGPMELIDLDLKRPALVSDSGLKVQIKAWRENNTVKFEISDKNNPDASYVSAQIELHSKRLDVREKLDVPIASINIDAQKNLYDPLLFHTGRFQCVQSILHVSPYKVYASVSLKDSVLFSKDYSPKTLTGNIAANDAMLHLVQMCVPNHTLLPISIGRIHWLDRNDPLPEECFIFAKENYRDKDRFNYEIYLLDKDQKILLHYRNATFKIVLEKGEKKILTPVLMEIAIRRTLDETNFSSVQISLDTSEQDLLYRPDGKPTLDNDLFISRSHCETLKLEIKSAENCGCDIEQLQIKGEEEWKKLLNTADFEKAKSSDLALNSICTRIWGARESMRKAGELTPVEIKFIKHEESNVLIFKSSNFNVLSLSYSTKEHGELIFSVCIPNTRLNKSFTYSHTVGFEETNLVGNVYFSNYVKWQGRARESFLHQNVMKISNKKGDLELISTMLSDGRLALVTCSTDCKFLRELVAFDEVIIHLTLDYIIENRIGMNFSYRKVTEEGEIIVATGKQEIACMERSENDHAIKNYRGNIPQEFKAALLPFIQQK